MLVNSVKQSEPQGYQPIANAARALGQMSAADLQRAQLLAKARSDGLRMIGWEDLLHEAIVRILDGSRRWPVGVPLIAFLAQTMRSVASDQRRRDAMFEDAGDISLPAASPSPDEQLDATRLLSRVSVHFAGDAGVMHLIEGLIAGETAVETQRRVGIDARAYDAARKRYWRGIAKLNGDQG